MQGNGLIYIQNVEFEFTVYIYVYVSDTKEYI